MVIKTGDTTTDTTDLTMGTTAIDGTYAGDANGVGKPAYNTFRKRSLGSSD